MKHKITIINKILFYFITFFKLSEWRNKNLVQARKGQGFLSCHENLWFEEDIVAEIASRVKFFLKIQIKTIIYYLFCRNESSAFVNMNSIT